MRRFLFLPGDGARGRRPEAPSFRKNSVKWKGEIPDIVKIDEPKTPYEYNKDEEEDDEEGELDKL